MTVDSSSHLSLELAMIDHSSFIYSARQIFVNKEVFWGWSRISTILVVFGAKSASSLSGRGHSGSAPALTSLIKNWLLVISLGLDVADDVLVLVGLGPRTVVSVAYSTVFGGQARLFRDFILHLRGSFTVLAGPTLLRRDHFLLLVMSLVLELFSLD